MTHWTCPTCNVPVATAFCSTCGEKHKDPREFTLRGLAQMTYNAFSPVDGKVMRSFIALVRRPGSLTVAFQRAQRIPFVGAFQLFVLANVLFFAVQSLGRMRVFTQPLAQRLSDDELFSAASRTLVEAHVARIGKTITEYAPLFDQAVAVNAKSLIGLMVPPFALLLSVVFWRRAQPLAVHMVFSLHFYAFFLVLFCLPLMIMEISELLGGSGEATQAQDDAMSVVLTLSVAAYLYAAIGPVFGTRGTWRVFQALVLALGTVAIFLTYRAALLPITLFTT